MARKFTNSVAAVTAGYPSAVYVPVDVRNSDANGYPVVGEQITSAHWTSVGGRWRAELDLVPLEQSSLVATDTSDSTVLTHIPWGETPAADEIAISLETGGVEVHDDRHTHAISFNYTGRGTAYTSEVMNRMQKELAATQTNAVAAPGSSTVRQIAVFADEEGRELEGAPNDAGFDAFGNIVTTNIPEGTAISGTNTGDVSLAGVLATILAFVGQTLGFQNQTANKVLAGPSTGADAEPTFRDLVDDDIPGALTLSTLINMVGTGTEFLRASATGVLERFNLFGTANEFTELQTMTDGIASGLGRFTAFSVANGGLKNHPVRVMEVLDVDAVGTTGGTAKAFTIPANTLRVDGDEVRMECVVFSHADTEFNVQIDSTQIDSNIVMQDVAFPVPVMLRVIRTDTDQGSALVVISADVNTAAPVGQFTNDLDTLLTGVVWTDEHEIKVFFDGGTPKLGAWRVEFHPAADAARAWQLVDEGSGDECFRALEGESYGLLRAYLPEVGMNAGSVINSFALQVRGGSSDAGVLVRLQRRFEKTGGSIWVDIMNQSVAVTTGDTWEVLVIPDSVSGLPHTITDGAGDSYRITVEPAIDPGGGYVDVRCVGPNFTELRF